jgi:hypothetical protein
MGFGISFPKINFGQIGKSLLDGAVKAVAPKVIESLKGVAGDLFTKGADGAKGLLGKVPLVGSLLSGMVDKFAPQLKGMIEGGLDKALKGLVEKFTGVKLENGFEVIKPGLSEQLGTGAQAQVSQAASGLGISTAQPSGGAAPTQQAASSGGAAPTQQAASGGGNFSVVQGGAGGSSGVGGASSGGSTVRGGSLDSMIKGSLATGEAAFSSAENEMLSAAAAGGASPAQLNQMKAQFKLQHLQELMSFISNYMKKMNDISMAVIGNMR